jgi:putative hemolysin
LLPSQGPADWPPLVRGYIKIGAKVLGAPAWDSDFGCADLPMMLDLSAMSPAYRKRFMGS